MTKEIKIIIACIIVLFMAYHAGFNAGANRVTHIVEASADDAYLYHVRFQTVHEILCNIRANL